MGTHLDDVRVSGAEGRAVDTRPRRRDGVPVRVAVLGPLLVDGDPLALARRDRVTLAALALHLGEPVRAETLAEALWGGRPPASSAKVIQGCVLRLRRTLGPGSVETVSGGYRLVLRRDDVDAALADDLARRARELLESGEPDRAGYLLDRARSLWRAEPYPDLVDWEPSAAERERLVELRRDLDELCAQVQLETGDHGAAIPTLRALVADAPTRERRWELLALAEYRSGRQADALETTRRARRQLDEELGLDAGPSLLALEEALLRQDPGLDAPAAVTDSGRCPYPGLLPYEVSDAEAFFGREEEVAAALRTLDRTRVITVAGPSGCGKSSLLRAGIAAAATRDGREAVVVTPGGWPSGLEVGASGVLVVDQLEELFDLEVGPQERVLHAVDAHVRGGGLLVLGLRADRMGELAGHPGLARYVESGLHLLGAMTEDDLRRAIVGPAEQAGLRLEPGLVDVLVLEVVGEPAALPLLSHVLRETWSVREGRTLTVAGYHTTGGVQEAVSRSAESVYDALGSGDRELLKQLMTRLVTIGDEGHPARRRVPVSTLDGDGRRHALVERLIAARLLSTDGHVVEIAHESLTLAWPRLRSWLDEDVEGQQIMRHLSVAADTWAQAGRPESELYRGQREQRASRWREQRTPDLTPDEGDFLDASSALARREREAVEEQARRDRVVNRRLRLGLAAVLVGAVVAAGAGVVAAASARRAADAALVADARRLGSEALRAKDLDTSLLYAVAAHRLDDSIDTRSALLAAVGKVPSLVTMTRTPRITALAKGDAPGLLFASSVDSSAMLVLDGATLRVVRRVPAASGPAVVSAADGSFAVSTVAVDDVRAGQAPVVLLDGSGEPSPRRLGGFPAGTYAFQDASVGPDNRHVAVVLHGDGDGPSYLGVWDVRSPEQPVALLEGVPGEAPVVDASGHRLFLVSDGTVQVLDLPSGAVRTRLTADDLRVPFVDPVLALSPDGSLLAVSAGPQVVLLDAASLARRATVVAPAGSDRIAFSPSGRLLAIAGAATLVLDVSRGEDPQEIFSQEGAGGWPVFSSDETTLFTSDFDGSVRAWDLAGGRGFLGAIRPREGAHQPDWGGRVSADGRRVVDVQPGPGFVVRTVADGTVSAFVDAGMTPHGSLDVAINADGSLVTMTASDPRVAVWDAAGDLVASRTLTGGEGAAFSWFTDDGGLVVSTTTGRLHVFDARTLDLRRPPIVVKDYDGVAGFVPRPRSHEVLLPLAGGTVVDLRSGDIRPAGLGVEPFGLAYSPDGARLVVTNRDGSVGLWDVAAQRWITSPTDAQPFAGWAPAWAPDGSEFVLVASGRAGRWDGRTGTFLGAATVGDVSTPGYAVDGRRILLVGNTGSVYVWDLNPASWMAAACRMAGRDLTEKEWSAQLPGRPREVVCPRATTT
jgi:DNA-binding SARP family transcriptional activator/WD40 repeat protein